jgi:uncharacterized damage-inducible protein DinB
MKEAERIIKLFEALYEGSPWIDVNIVGILNNITSDQAIKKIRADRNSIWEIVNHLINWRVTVLQRIQDIQGAVPDNNYFEPVNDASDSAWKNTLHRLENSQQQWIDFLKTFSGNDFEKLVQNKTMTYYEHIHGIIQHDAYHLGQITLLSKLI